MLHRTNSFSCFQIVSFFRCTITHRFAKWYENTLLSNSSCLPIDIRAFYYLMKLHYSQTLFRSVREFPRFYYLVKLHYSQTVRLKLMSILKFYYLMKLHYSQTMNDVTNIMTKVLLPYEITLLSNRTLEINEYTNETQL